MKCQKLLKTLIRSRFQDKYWRAHKTATLTSIQHTVPLQGVTFSNAKKRSNNIDWNFMERSIQNMNLKLLREDLHGDPHQFLVNQILLSVQFFKNFER